MAERRVRAGRVEAAVRRDLNGMGEVGKSTLAELALVLSRAIDTRGMDDGPSTTVKLVAELRVTLNQLREVVRDSGGGGEDEGMPAPAWDGAEPGSADVGAAGGGGGAAAG
jgi:hypothetical protein